LLKSLRKTTRGGIREVRQGERREGRPEGGYEGFSLVGINDIRRQYCGASACNLHSLAANLVWKKGEEGEVRPGFIGDGSKRPL
jgi:hypothetical protein